MHIDVENQDTELLLRVGEGNGNRSTGEVANLEGYEMCTLRVEQGNRGALAGCKGEA